MQSKLKTRFILRTLLVAFVIAIAAASVRITLVAAANLTLQQIGVSTVGGRRISSWTYMGSNPVISGTADPGATVTISIDAVPATVTADSSGTWSYTPTTLTGEGTFQIVISSGAETISFTLALSPYTGGAAYTSTASGVSKGGVTNELPVSGNVADTIKLIGVGLGLISMGFMSWWLAREWAHQRS